MGNSYKFNKLQVIEVSIQEIRKYTRPIVYRDKTKFTRKAKHKCGFATDETPVK